MSGLMEILARGRDPPCGESLVFARGFLTPPISQRGIRARRASPTVGVEALMRVLLVGSARDPESCDSPELSRVVLLNSRSSPETGSFQSGSTTLRCKWLLSLGFLPHKPDLRLICFPPPEGGWSDEVELPHHHVSNQV